MVSINKEIHLGRAFEPVSAGEYPADNVRGSCVKVVNALVVVRSHAGSTTYNGSDSGQISKQI
jgi:hypothetical protein